MVFGQDKSSRSWISLICVLLLHCIEETTCNTHCSRPLSRIVRNQLTEHFYSVFQDRNHEPHSKCPLHASRDLYRIQEGNKTQEYAAKWVCHFCGKAFFSEHHLDVHFDNKHSDKLVKGSTVCLADFCDIFRCDVFEVQRKDYFWEKKLCKEDKLMVRKRRCEALMRSCLPQGNLSVGEEFEILETIGSNTCSLLNCKDYWKRPHNDISAWKIVLYAVVSPFFCMGLIVYYYAIWDYYYGDYPLDTKRSREEEESFSTFGNYRSTPSHLRKRYGERPLMY
ncbi:hypothetical protein OS493_007724 [Desmophyllum pertusum]|uniref:C2H2-type domain-containing protein n=1 Tax=Desmophyllum pertusum TaxID=174260 RepID=A0A9W9YUI9_9CNID|nr:hypothetical protein OS493_007724 [Desmophyllum pertusum]